MFNKIDINKDFPEDIVEPLTFGPAALGLLRVGSKPSLKSQQQNQKLEQQRKNETSLLDSVFSSMELSSSTSKISLPQNLEQTTKMNLVKPPQQVFYRNPSYKRPQKPDEQRSKIAKIDSTGEFYTGFLPAPKKPFFNLIEHKSNINEITVSENDSSIHPLSPSSSASLALQKNSMGIRKQVAKEIGYRLFHLLRSRESFNWSYYEFFYSYIDLPYYNGVNNFENYLKTYFPKLKTSNLRKNEWQKIRSLMGKPSRFSPKFILNERTKLELLRRKIRYIQSHHQEFNADMKFFQNMPNEIPLSLPVGTKVLVHLRHPEKGLFSGVIINVNFPKDFTRSTTIVYSVKFDRSNLGTFAIPDNEIMSLDYHRKIPLNTLIVTSRARNVVRGTLNQSNKQIKPSASSSASSSSSSLSLTNANKNNDNGTNNDITVEVIGNYPAGLVQLMIDIRKSIESKDILVKKLTSLNNHVLHCKRKNQHESIDDDFHMNYTQVILNLEEINNFLLPKMQLLQKYSNILKTKLNFFRLNSENELLEKCKQKAEELVYQYSDLRSLSENRLNLIIKFVTLTILSGYLKSTETRNHAIKSLEAYMEVISQQLDPDNKFLFSNLIRVHFRRMITHYRSQNLN